MRNVIVLVVFFAIALASMWLHNVYVLLAAPIVASLVSVALIWPRTSRDISSGLRDGLEPHHTVRRASVARAEDVGEEREQQH